MREQIVESCTNLCLVQRSMMLMIDMVKVGANVCIDKYKVTRTNRLVLRGFWTGC